MTATSYILSYISNVTRIQNTLIPVDSISQCDRSQLQYGVSTDQNSIWFFILSGPTPKIYRKADSFENELINAIATINNYRELSENWDSYGGLEIYRDIIEKSLVYVDALVKYRYSIQSNKLRISTAPLSNGGIDIYLDYIDKSLYISIDKDSTTALKIENRNSVIEQITEFKIEYNEFENILVWLFN